jgi:hypothetical protein
MHMETEVKTKVDMAPMAVVKSNGEAAAAILGAGLGSLAYGLTVTITEAVPAVKTMMGSLNPPVGPLAGKTLTGVVLWLIIWGALHFMWKDKEVDFSRVFTLSIIAILVGFLGTFPVFYDLFVPK